MPKLDAVVVGAGPNGLAAAITLACAGLRVRVLEGSSTAGGGCRSAQLTLPGFVHDTCATIHGLAPASPFFRSVPMAELGVELAHPDAPLAHPLDGGEAAMLERSLERTAAGLDGDGAAFRRLMAPLAAHPDGLMREVLRPLRLPGRPILLARFGLRGAWPAAALAGAAFQKAPARALFAGVAAHSMLRLSQPFSAAFGLILSAVGLTYGWPVVRGGSQRLAEALARHLAQLGGEIEVDHPVRSMPDLPDSRFVIFDLTPRAILEIAGSALPDGYRRRLPRFRYGPGVFKMDWALRAPIPWAARGARRAGTVHLGGTLGEIARAEAEVWRGVAPSRPFVILVQPTLADPGRAPGGGHTAWAYCHVPSGSEVDMTARIEAQVERFAPGFSDVILARHAMGPKEVERRNPNFVGGDINGGVQDARQLFARPALRWNPYSTPNPRLFMCSSSTSPGGGVHGMSGHLAALTALRRLRRGAG